MSEKKNIDLTSIISAVIKIPGVMVSREEFLREHFADVAPDMLDVIIEKGPVEAGCSREQLEKLAKKITKKRSGASAGVSFLAGIPGGLAMAATIPADILQFYGVAIRLAQELVYIYGEKDMWCDNANDPDKVTNQLILYCGVMLGAVGAAETVRIMSSALAKQALKKLPQQALTKTFFYPIIKAILKFFGVHITKSSFAKGVSKVVPVVGGVVSGGITYASMLPMGKRLIRTLDEAHFDYTEVEFEEDMIVIEQIIEEESNEDSADVDGDNVANTNKDDVFRRIKEANDMLAQGIITEEEFAQIKAKLISEM